MNLVAQLLKRLYTNIPRTVILGDHRVRLPRGHRLDWHRFRHSRYDEPIADLAKILHTSEAPLYFIDIGANIGDTAALASVHHDVRVLCIEGNDRFIPLLKANLRRISSNCKVVECFVGSENATLAGRVQTAHGSAHIERNIGPNANSTVATRSLESILRDNPEFLLSQLIKIDTDGMDAGILLSAQSILEATRPILYFECSPLAKRDNDEWENVFDMLVDIGYQWFHVYDNFGNHLLRVEAAQRSQLTSLSAYLRNTRKDLRPAIFYYDVCAIGPRGSSISSTLLARYEADSWSTLGR